MKDILSLIGNTPLVEIRKINSHKKVAIYAKLEGFNPSGSVKDRIALYMIKKAEENGKLYKGVTIIEPTSGNTGISVAMVGTIKGYMVKIVMPDTMSIERRKIIKAYGAELILVKGTEWRDAAIRFTKKLAKENNYFMPNQYESEYNTLAHYEGTGEEILNQVNKRIDVFVAGIGTGGTVMGSGKRLKEKYQSIKIVGVEPYPDSEIQGLRNLQDYTPKIFNPSFLDKKVMIRDKDAFRTTRELARKEGLFVGLSSGAAMFVALQEAKELKEGTIVTIFPDRGDKYLSTRLFQ